MSLFPTRFYLRALFLFLTASYAFLPSLRAQYSDNSLPRDFRQLAPSNMPHGQGAPQQEYTPTRSLQHGSSGLYSRSLRAIVLFPKPEDIYPEGIVDVPEGWATFVELPDAPDIWGLRDRLQTFIGQPVDRTQIDKIIKVVIEHYRENGRPVIDVYLPPQAFINDTVQLVAFEATLGEVKVEGNEWFPSKRFTKHAGVEAGQKINKNKIDAKLAYLNQNPFRTVSSAFEAGAIPHTSDLIINVDDRFPVRPFAGFDDSGTRLTSYETFYSGFNWGDAFMIDGQLNYQHTRRKKAGFLTANSLSYIQPLPWKQHSVTLYTSQSKADLSPDRISIPGNIISDIDSSTAAVGMRYNAPLTFNAVPNLKHNFNIGFDFKRSKNGNVLANVVQPDRTTDVFQLALGYQGNYNWKRGNISYGANLHYSPGGVGGHNKNGTTALPGNPDYVIVQPNITAVTRLPLDFTAITRAEAQFSSATLAGSELFAVGGATTIRGYDTSEAVGEEGYLLSAELRSPVLKPLSGFGNITNKDIPVQDNLQLLFFLDYGGIRTKTGLPFKDTTLFSIGPGLRYSIGRFASLKFDYGFQMTDSNITSNLRNTRNGRAHMSVEVSY